MNAEISSEKSPWIIDTTDATFEQDVIQRSHELPVVVDFWASWCQPCKLLGPLLEQVARDYDGKFLLVKADTEKTPRAATEFAVQAIPTVYGLRDGHPVDFFAGLLPDAQLRAWIDRLLPTPAEQLTAEARKLAATDPATAEAKYRQAIELAPADAAAQIGLAQLLLDQRRIDDSAAVIEQLERRGFLEPEAEKIKAALDIHRQGQQVGTVEQCRAQAAANPQNFGLQLQLAEALAAAGAYEEALETALGVVKADKAGHGKRAREIMVDLFRLLPEDSELVGTYRRKLAAALY